jgi:hypothetical protein
VDLVARAFIAIYIGMAGIFLLCLVLVLFADPLSLSGGAFAASLSFMVMSGAGLVLSFPFAYYAAKSLESERQ